MLNFFKKIFIKNKTKTAADAEVTETHIDVVRPVVYKEKYDELRRELGCPKCGRGGNGFPKEGTDRYNRWFNSQSEDNKNKIILAKAAYESALATEKNKKLNDRLEKRSEAKAKLEEERIRKKEERKAKQEQRRIEKEKIKELARRNKSKDDDENYEFCDPENVMPKKLMEITKYLRNEFELVLSKEHEDDRINSALDEAFVIRAIIKGGFDIEKPGPREWYDFGLTENGTFIPVNIKVTSMNGPDNINSKEGLYYALTGKFPRFKSYSWDTFFEDLALNNNEFSDDYDYYFLVVNKNDTNDVFCTSLKHIKKLRANGNNPPFQVTSWEDNRELVERTDLEAKNYLLGVLGETLEKRAEPFHKYLEYKNKNC